MVTHPGTSHDEQGSTFLSGRDVMLSLWYSDSERIFFLISKVRKGNKERKKSLILAGKIKSEKMRGMKMFTDDPFSKLTVAILQGQHHVSSSQQS